MQLETTRMKHLAILAKLACVLLLHMVASGIAHSDGEKLYRTGLRVECGNFAISPNGESLIFDTRTFGYRLRLIDLKSGENRTLPQEPDRDWRMVRWGNDGRHLVAISTLIRDSNYIIGDQRVILVDSRDWSHRVVAEGDGVKISPFFSADGKSIYYFKGKARTSGKTLAAGFDLYSIDLASLKEEKLTDQAFYQVSVGEMTPDGNTVLFSGIGAKNFPGLKNALGVLRDLIFAFDTRSKRLTPITDNIPPALLGQTRPRLDANGAIYFKSATKGPRPFYDFSVYKMAKSGESPARVITELASWASFEIDKRSGDIFTPEMQHGELVFRRTTASRSGLNQTLSTGATP